MSFVIRQRQRWKFRAILSNPHQDSDAETQRRRESDLKFSVSLRLWVDGRTFSVRQFGSSAVYNSLVTEETMAAKWGTRAAAAVRVAGKTRQGRLAGAVLRGLQATGRSFLRVLHLLFLEVTGALFLWIALVGGFACWREYQAMQAHPEFRYKFIVAALFTVMFLWFGVTSFWRARRKNKT
jgi:hypothetical protein